MTRVTARSVEVVDDAVEFCIKVWLQVRNDHVTRLRYNVLYVTRLQRIIRLIQQLSGCDKKN